MNETTNTALPISLSEANDAAHTLYLAFKNDPMMQWLFVSGDNYAKNAQATFATWVRYSIRYGYAFRTTNFESIALRKKPSDTTFSFWRAFRSGMLATRSLMGKEGFNRLMLLDKTLHQAAKNNMVKSPYLYCWVLGTLPDKQGQGHGGRLMKQTFALANKLNVPCYLETATDLNIQVHGHQGYEVLNTHQMPGANFQMICMLRKNQTDSP